MKAIKILLIMELLIVQLPVLKVLLIQLEQLNIYIYIYKFYLQKKYLPKTPNKWEVVYISYFVQNYKIYKIKNFNKSKYYYRLWCYTNYKIELYTIITNIKNFKGQLASGIYRLIWGDNPISWITTQFMSEGEFKLLSSSRSDVKIKELYIERKKN